MIISRKFLSLCRLLTVKQLKLLSDKVKEIVTDDVLKKVKEGIDPNKKLDILKAGYYKTMDGISHPIFKYKYAGDSSSKEVISAVFEDDGKFLEYCLLKNKY
jgi:hypothetical protein